MNVKDTVFENIRSVLDNLALIELRVATYFTFTNSLLKSIEMTVIRGSVSTLIMNASRIENVDVPSKLHVLEFWKQNILLYDSVFKNMSSKKHEVISTPHSKF
jgi:hypothetical protein